MLALQVSKTQVNDSSSFLFPGVVISCAVLFRVRQSRFQLLLVWSSGLPAGFVLEKHSKVRREVWRVRWAVWDIISLCGFCGAVLRIVLASLWWETLISCCTDVNYSLATLHWNGETYNNVCLKGLQLKGRYKDDLQNKLFQSLLFFALLTWYTKSRTLFVDIISDTRRLTTTSFLFLLFFQTPKSFHVYPHTHTYTPVCGSNQVLT